MIKAPTPPQEDRGQLNCLLADFTAVKSEISRRSDLQRVVAVTYLGVVAFAVHEGATGSANSFWIPMLWGTSYLALQFHVREHLEIARLSGLIRTKIAPTAAKLLNVSEKNIFHSETDPESTNTSLIRRRYYYQFFWTIFLGFPALISLWFAGAKWERRGLLLCFSTRYPWIAVTSVVGAGFTTWLLYRWFWPKRTSN